MGRALIPRACHLTPRHPAKGHQQCMRSRGIAFLARIKAFRPTPESSMSTYTTEQAFGDERRKLPSRLSSPAPAATLSLPSG